MELVNNKSIFKEIETGLDSIQKDITSDIILSPFTKDFSLRFCWSSNAIEGSTLSLDETISLIEYDEVRAGHTYTEYHDAKNLLPIAIKPTGKYRQAFQSYEKNGDLYLMVYQICKAELEAIQRVQCLIRKREQLPKGTRGFYHEEA